VSRYYLGIDGGQSSTTALIADEHGRVIGIGRGGPCNHVSGAEAREKFLSVVGACLEQATQNIRSHSTVQPEFAAACLGFSGGAEDKTAHARELIQSALLKVTHDAEIALVGATAGAPGIVIIAGTGSIAFGRNAELRTARAGGWGYIFGDEGSAFDIVRRALRASLQQEEGWGPATQLSATLCRATGSSSVNELLHRFYGQIPRHTVASFAGQVAECAETGDLVAQQILEEAARCLSWYVEGVYRNLFSGGQNIPVAHIGGVFQSTRLRLAFTEEIRNRIGCQAIYPKLSPAAGALLEALQMDGNDSPLTGIPETKT
jgi:N-acetylglucosamine kinase-like BadF-type ATPase